MNRWKLKKLWISPFQVLPKGDLLYEFLTAIVLGTQCGMSRKWCYWFREHVVLCRRYAKLALAGKRLWLFQPGWSLAPVILGTHVTGNSVLVTEDRRRLARRYVDIAIEKAKEAARKLRAATHDGSLAGAISELHPKGSPAAVLKHLDAQYIVGKLDALKSLPSGSIDACLSMGRLEHFSAAELGELFDQMHRILAPDGVGSHIIDHRDHFWYYDKSIHCFNHLTVDDEKWASICRGRKWYRNRLLEPDYVRLFEEHGFAVLKCVHELHRTDAANVDPASLWGPHKNLTRDDLQVAVSHIVVRRR